MAYHSFHLPFIPPILASFPLPSKKSKRFVKLVGNLGKVASTCGKMEGKPAPKKESKVALLDKCNKSMDHAPKKTS